MVIIGKNLLVHSHKNVARRQKYIDDVMRLEILANIVKQKRKFGVNSNEKLRVYEISCSFFKNSSSYTIWILIYVCLLTLSNVKKTYDKNHFIKNRRTMQYPFCKHRQRYLLTVSASCIRSWLRKHNLCHQLFYTAIAKLWFVS